MGLRAEVFNLLNTTNFGAPARRSSGASEFRHHTTRTHPRIVQLALKLCSDDRTITARGLVGYSAQLRLATATTMILLVVGLPLAAGSLSRTAGAAAGQWMRCGAAARLAAHRARLSTSS